MAENDVRWIQRFSNFNKAYNKLSEVINSTKLSELSELEREGLIQRFEYTFELAWNVMKDYSHYQGNSPVNGPRDAIREAFQNNLISDGETWMAMIVSRNKTSHTYNSQTAEDIAQDIYHRFGPLFSSFKTRMEYFQSGQVNLFE